MWLNRDIVLLFLTRIIRMFSYGFLTIVLVLYLVKIGFNEVQIGLLLTGTLLGDAVISLWITTSADRMGRRKMLVLGAVLLTLAGSVFVLTHNFIVLLLAAIVGVISPSGKEIGPFLSIEQAALAQFITNERRTHVFAWYNLVGSLATALGALGGGWAVQILVGNGADPIFSYQVLFIGYALTGIILAVLFLQLTPAIEAEPKVASTPKRPLLGLQKSRGIVFKLSALFALDSFGAGFILQSMMVYWFKLRFGMDPGVLGSIFFGANLLAGVSALLASRIAAKIGLVNTMVYSHIPSNILLCLVPFMPFGWLAVTVLLLRFSISQMDVPTRQSYTMAVVDPDERSAASGVTTIARSVGGAISPALTGAFLTSAPLLKFPFLIAGGLKIIYDLILYKSFKGVRPPGERRQSLKG